MKEELSYECCMYGRNEKTGEGGRFYLAPEEGEPIGKAAFSSGLEEARDILQEHFGKRLVLIDATELSVHRPAQDGASGQLGHLGTCIARVFRVRQGRKKGARP